jgi:hypothetical protein
MERPSYFNPAIETEKPSLPSCFIKPRHDVKTVKANPNITLEEDYSQPKILKFSRADERRNTTTETD